MVRLKCSFTNLVSNNVVVCERQRAHVLETFGENPPQAGSARLRVAFELCNLGYLWVHLSCLTDWYVSPTTSILSLLLSISSLKAD